MAIGDKKVLVTQTYADSIYDRKDNITDDNNTYDSSKKSSAKALAQLVDRVEVLEAGDVGGGSSYTLPVATDTILGGVKIGVGLTITDGVLSATGDGGGGSTNTISKYSYTTIFGQTTFSATYDVGYVDVFLNGIKLDDADFTATNGTSITLIQSCLAGDIINISGYSSVAIGNSVSYTKIESDAIIGNINTILDNINGVVI